MKSRTVAAEAVCEETKMLSQKVCSEDSLSWNKPKEVGLTEDRCFRND